MDCFEQLIRKDMTQHGVISMVDKNIYRSISLSRAAFGFWFKHIYFKSNIHGSNNIVIYLNIIGSERKHYSLFGSTPNHVK